MITLQTGETRRIATELGELAVHVVGDGPPVVAWHSLFVDSRSWSRLIPLLPNRRFYLIDAPCFGESDRLVKPVDVSACTRAAAQVLDALAPELGGPVDWVGNAWGGHVGIELAATRGDLIRSLVSISAPTFPIPASLRIKIHLLLPMYRMFGARGPVRSTIMATLLTDRSRTHDADAVELIDRCLADSAGAAVPAIATCVLNRTDLRWAAREIGCPTLFVATDDRGEWTADQARPIVGQMRSASLRSVAGARVIPALEQPEQLAAHILDFWTS